MLIGGPIHDSKYAIHTIRKIRKYKPVGFCMDKSFIPEHINEELKSNQHGTAPRCRTSLTNHYIIKETSWKQPYQ